MVDNRVPGSSMGKHVVRSGVWMPRFGTNGNEVLFGVDLHSANEWFVGLHPTHELATTISAA